MSHVACSPTSTQEAQADLVDQHAKDEGTELAESKDNMVNASSALVL